MFAKKRINDLTIFIFGAKFSECDYFMSPQGVCFITIKNIEGF